MYTVTGLQPFTMYRVVLEAGNQYTQIGDGSNVEEILDFKTTEGGLPFLSSLSLSLSFTLTHSLIPT